MKNLCTLSILCSLIFVCVKMKACFPSSECDGQCMQFPTMAQLVRRQLSFSFKEDDMERIKKHAAPEALQVQLDQFFKESERRAPLEKLLHDINTSSFMKDAELPQFGEEVIRPDIVQLQAAKFVFMHFVENEPIVLTHPALRGYRLQFPWSTFCDHAKNYATVFVPGLPKWVYASGIKQCAEFGLIVVIQDEIVSSKLSEGLCTIH